MRKALILLLFFILIWGCFWRTPPQKNEIKEITFWTLQMNDFSDYISKIIKSYETIHPDVRIKWIDVPFSEGEKRTIAAIMSNNPPDLINLNPDFSALLAQKGTLEPIPEIAATTYNDEIINSLKYNGVLYSIPWYATSSITIYNKNLFSKTNINKIPKTYDELAYISKDIKQKTGAYAFLPTITENDTMARILNKYGVSEIEEYNSKNSQQVFSMFKNLYQNNLIPKEALSYTHREALEQYMAGKVVFIQGGANFLKLIEENAPSIYAQTEISEQLKGSIGQNDFSVMNFVIPKRAKNKKEALDFCLYLTNANNQLELAKLTNIIATNQNTLANDFYNDYSNLNAKARSISAKQINQIYPQLKQRKAQKEINTQLNTTVQIILMDKKPIKEALINLVKNLQTISKK